MTLEEAITIIKNEFSEYADTLSVYAEKRKMAFDMAIKALEEEPCEDCISIGVFEQVKWERDVAIEQLEQLGYSLGEKIRTSEDCISREEALNKINELIAEYIPLMPTGWTLPLNIAKTINELPSVTPSIPDVENDFNLGYNCGYADAMIDIAESEEEK